MSHSQLVYLATNDVDEDEVMSLPLASQSSKVHNIYRRGIDHGWIAEMVTVDGENIDPQLWQQGEPLLLRNAVSNNALEQYEPSMEQTYKLVEGVLDGDSVVQLMESEGFFERLAPDYEFIGGFSDESDYQGIEQLEFEATENGKVLADNIWMKASWLSFEDEDASLRFRFSYGREGLEDVAQSFQKEMLTAELSERVFPESALITRNQELIGKVSAITGINKPAFVERIFYFNAPNGGAQFHHDVERGHEGVVFAQLVGSTAWLALAKPRLLDELQKFLKRDDIEIVLQQYFSIEEIEEILIKVDDRQFWSDCLDNRDNELAEQLLNHISEFFADLVTAGYGYVLHPGDVILLPQADLQNCCWHTVFCLDDFPGEALSFAIRDSE